MNLRVEIDVERLLGTKLEAGQPMFALRSSKRGQQTIALNTEVQTAHVPSAVQKLGK